MQCGEEHRPGSSSLCHLLHSPVAPSPLRPNIFFNTLFSKTLSPKVLPHFSNDSRYPLKIKRIEMFKFFKSAEKFKFLETSLPNTNYIHDGLRRNQN
jgi:hypothetical protein